MADHSEYFDKVAQTVVDCDKDACLRLLDEGDRHRSSGDP